MKRSKAVALLVSILVLALIGGPAAVAKGSVVEEAVVSTLTPDGSVDETFVSQLIHLDSVNGEEAKLRVPDAADLESYRNLSGFSGPAGEGDDLVWRTDGTLDARALAKMSKDLPIEVHVKYFLDEAEVIAADLKGEDGEVRIEIEVVNVSGEPQSIEYRAVTSPYLTSVVNTYIPVEYTVRVEFPEHIWSGIGGEGVHVQPRDDTHVAVASGILTPPLTSDRASVDVFGVGEDILAPRIQVFAIPKISQTVISSLDAQYEALQALYGGVGEIAANLDKIHDGVVQMVDGSKEILDAVGERDPDTGDGVVTKDAKGKAETLIGGLQSSKDTYDEDLIPGANKALDGINQMIAALEGPATDLTGGLEDITDGLALLIGNLQTNSSINPGFHEGMELVQGGLQALLAGLQTNSLAAPGFKEGLDLLMLGLGNTANPPDTVTVIGTLETLLAGFGDIANPPDVVTVIGTLETLQASAAGASLAATFGVAPFPAPDPVAAAVLDSLADGLALLLATVQTNHITGVDDDLDGLIDEDGGVPFVDDDLDGLIDEDGEAGFREGLVGLLGGLQGFQEGLEGLLAGLGDTGDPPTDATVIGAVQLMIAGMGDLLAALGEAGEAVPDTDTVIGALEAIYGGMQQVTPGSTELVAGILGGLSALRVGFTSPSWTQTQDALGGRTPKEYFQDCPGCFDPEHPAFDVATAGFSPGFRDVFVLFSEGLDSAIDELHSFDDAEPGLVDALEQLRDGLQTVEGGVFLINELGVRTARGQLGEEGNTVGRDQAALAGRLADARVESALGGGANVVFTTYVFDIPAQSTAARDNVVRGGLLALALATLALIMVRRPRMLTN